MRTLATVVIAVLSAVLSAALLACGGGGDESPTEDALGQPRASVEQRTMNIQPVSCVDATCR